MTSVKICGLKTEEALDWALDAGADLVGLVFFPKSPRNVDLTTAAALGRYARRTSEADVVALLVDPADADIDAVIASAAPDILQLHGRETPERVAEIRTRTGLRILKAVAVAEPADVARAEAYYAPGTCADMILFDAKPPADPGALPGGNGLSFDWRILDGVARRMPFALAGGLTPENAGEAADLTGAAILDVSSGVESSPGEKDEVLIRRFLQAAKTSK